MGLIKTMITPRCPCHREVTCWQSHSPSVTAQAHKLRPGCLQQWWSRSKEGKSERDSDRSRCGSGEGERKMQFPESDLLTEAISFEVPPPTPIPADNLHNFLESSPLTS